MLVKMSPRSKSVWLRAPLSQPLLLSVGGETVEGALVRGTRVELVAPLAVPEIKPEGGGDRRTDGRGMSVLEIHLGEGQDGGGPWLYRPPPPPAPCWFLSWVWLTYQQARPRVI